MKLRQLIAYAIGPIGNAAIGLLLLPLIAWYFPADDIGRVTLLQILATLVLITLNLGLDQAYIREYHAANHRASLFKTIASVPLSSLFIVSVLLLLSGQLNTISTTLLGETNQQLGYWLMAFAAAILLSRYLSLILRMEERAWALSFSQLLPKILIVLLVGMVSIGQSQAIGLIAIYTLAQWCTVLWLIWQTRKQLWAAWRAPFSYTLLKSHLHYGVPLMLSGLAYWGLSSADRWLLQRWGNLAELGVYSLAINFGAVALIVQNIFATVWSPMVFKWVNEQRDLALVRTVFGHMLAAVWAILCMVGLASPLIPWLLPADYAAVQFIVLSSIFVPLLYTLTEISGIGINVCKKTALLPIISLLAFILNIGLCYWWIPLWGAQGAAMAVAVAFWLFFILKTELSMYLWQRLPRLHVYGATLAALLSCLAYTHYGKDYYVWFALGWGMVLTGLGWHYRASLQKIKRHLMLL